MIECCAFDDMAQTMSFAARAGVGTVPAAESLSWGGDWKGIPESQEEGSTCQGRRGIRTDESCFIGRSRTPRYERRNLQGKGLGDDQAVEAYGDRIQPRVTDNAGLNPSLGRRNDRLARGGDEDRRIHPGGDQVETEVVIRDNGDIQQIDANLQIGADRSVVDSQDIGGRGRGIVQRVKQTQVGVSPIPLSGDGGAGDYRKEACGSQQETECG